MLVEGESSPTVAPSDITQVWPMVRGAWSEIRRAPGEITLCERMVMGCVPVSEAWSWMVREAGRETGGLGAVALGGARLVDIVRVLTRAVEEGWVLMIVEWNGGGRCVVWRVGS